MTRRWLAIALLGAAALSCRSRRAVPLGDLAASGYAALDSGDLEAAGTLAQQGLARAREEAHAPSARAFQVLQAEVLMKRREAQRALEILSAPEPPGTRPEVHVRALMTEGFARCYLAAQASADTEPGQERMRAAEQAAAEIGSEPLQAEVWLRRGSCFMYDPATTASAEALFQQVLASGVRLKLRHVEANAAGSLGLLRLRTGRYDDAADWLERSLALTAGLNADTIDAKLLTNLGWCYTELGDTEKALPLLRRVEAMARRHGYREELELALAHMGHCHLQLADYAEARRRYEEAFDVARAMGRQEDAQEFLEMLQTAALRSGDLAGAQAYARQAGPATGVSGVKGAPTLIEAELKVAQRDFANAILLYQAILKATPSADERWRASAGLASLYVTVGRKAEAERAFREAQGAIEGMLAGLQQDTLDFLLYSSLTEFYGRYAAFLVDDGRAAEALAVIDHSRGRVLWERVRAAKDRPAPPRRFEDVARAARAVLLSYWTGERSFLWVVTAHGTSVHQLPPAAELRRQVEDYQALVLRSRDPLAEGSAGAGLYQVLIGPAAAAITPETRVVVVADGPLQQLSFDTLVVPSPRPHYWLEDVVTLRAPSLTLLGGGSSARPPQRPLLVIGDPIQANDAFAALPNAGREIQSVERHFAGEALVLTGAAATPAAFRATAPERFNLIHFAAHAASNNERPLESAVVLSPDKAEYKLYAHEILNRPIHAELVTLSSCRGAGARSYRGEGLVGFAWVFLQAGARHVIAGLWDVEDASTAELMDGLYQGLAEGLAPPEALRRARLALLRSSTAHRKPYYWGPFVVFAQRQARR